MKKGDEEGARQAVSMIVGRDTKRLDGAGITRAAVETVAENTSDGVIAPFLYMALFGAAGGFFYKAVNTMDSMIGYKNDKYLILDGQPPGWMTSATIFQPDLGQFFLPYLPFCWAMTENRPGRSANGTGICHASPNSAHGEAAIAGALHIRLAGDAWYFGKLA